MSRIGIVIVFIVFISLHDVLHSVAGGSAARFYRAGPHKASDDYIVVIHEKLAKALHVPGFIERIKRDYNVIPQRHFHIGNFVAIIVKGEESDIKRLLDVAEIDFIEENHIVRSGADVGPFCQNYVIDLTRWGLVRINTQSEMPKDCKSNKCVYTYGNLDDGKDVYVYVLDTGIRLDHEEFDGRAIWGYTAERIAQSEADDDNNGHGTHVAGIATGRNYGVARLATPVAVKVMDKYGSGSEIDVLEGINWAINDMVNNNRKGVCNLSLGTPTRAMALENGIINALSQGVPFAVAAGNEARDACLGSPSALGQSSDTITVGATTIRDQLSGFSNYGPCVNILAPGENIVSAYPSTTSSLAVMNGTSMASPFVAGVIARHLSQNQQKQSPSQIKQWLLATSTKDMITLQWHAFLYDTPNNLLHFSCNAAQPLQIVSTMVIWTLLVSKCLLL